MHVLVTSISKHSNIFAEHCPAMQALYLGGDASQIAFLAGGSLLLVPMEVSFPMQLVHHADWNEDDLS